MFKKMKKMIDKTRNTYTEEMKLIYRKPKIYNVNADKGYDPKWVVDAVEHALTSKYPKTRYSTTPVGTMIYFASFILPDRILEKLLAYNLGEG